MLEQSPGSEVLYMISRPVSDGELTCSFLKLSVATLLELLVPPRTCTGCPVPSEQALLKFIRFQLISNSYESQEEEDYKLWPALEPTDHVCQEVTDISSDIHERRQAMPRLLRLRLIGWPKLVIFF